MLAALLALVALGLAGCERGPGPPGQEPVALGGGGGELSEAALACLDASRQQGMAVSPDDCQALEEVGLLCADGLPECGERLDGERWLRACRAINRHFLGGDIESPLPCMQALEQRSTCPNGWPDAPLGPAPCPQRR